MAGPREREDILKKEFALNGSAFCLAFSPDGKTLAASGSGKVIKLWNVEKGEAIANLDGHTSDVYSLIFAPDGKTLFSASWDRTVMFWDVRTLKSSKVIKHPKGVTSLAVTSDGAILATGGGSGDPTIRLWALPSGELRLILTGHSSTIRGLSVSNDNKTLASASADGSFRLWKISNGENTATVSGEHRDVDGGRDGVNCIRYSPDGKLLATLGVDNRVIIWDVATMKKQTSFQAHAQPQRIQSISFIDSKNVLVSASERGRDFPGEVKLWDASKGKELPGMDRRPGGVWCLAVSPAGDVLATGDVNGRIQFTDLTKVLRSIGTKAP